MKELTNLIIAFNEHLARGSNLANPPFVVLLGHVVDDFPALALADAMMERGKDDAARDIIALIGGMVVSGIVESSPVNDWDYMLNQPPRRRLAAQQTIRNRFEVSFDDKIVVVTVVIEKRLRLDEHYDTYASFFCLKDQPK